LSEDQFFLRLRQHFENDLTFLLVALSKVISKFAGIMYEFSGGCQLDDEATVR
jgi:hypothetical protein